MKITTVSSREFNQDVSKIKKASQNGPVFITDRGSPAHVLMTIDEYQKLAKKTQNIAELLAMPSVDEIDFEPAKIKGPLFKPEDYS